MAKLPSDRRRTAQRIKALGEIKVARGCADCGYAEHSVALDFDHRPGVVKRGAISKLVERLSWDLLLVEVAKCDVVCSNCHRVRTLLRGQNSSRPPQVELTIKLW